MNLPQNAKIDYDCEKHHVRANSHFDLLISLFHFGNKWKIIDSLLQKNCYKTIELHL